MTLTARLELFDTALAVTSDNPAALEAAGDHPPAWASGYEWQSPTELWLWLCVRDVPSPEEIERWRVSVESAVAEQSR